MLSAIEGIHADLQEIKAALVTIARTLTEERGFSSVRQCAPRDAQLLSLREAARRLGVDRNTTLMKLIRTGQLRGVENSGRLRIPAAEIERLGKLDRPSAPQPSVPTIPAPVPSSRSRKTRQRRRPRPATSPDIRDLEF